MVRPPYERRPAVEQVTNVKIRIKADNAEDATVFIEAVKAKLTEAVREVSPDSVVNAELAGYAEISEYRTPDGSNFYASTTLDFLVQP
jgi:hypothetical protein